MFSTNTNDLQHLWLVGFADQRSCEEPVRLEQPRLSVWSLFKYKEITSVNLPAKRRKNTWRRNVSFRGSFVSSWSKKGGLFTFYWWVSINTTAAHRWLQEQNATICTYSVFHLLGFIWGTGAAHGCNGLLGAAWNTASFINELPLMFSMK